MRSESAQLTIAEWIELSEALHQRAERLGREGREILDDVVKELASLPRDPKIDKVAVYDVIHDIEHDWRVVDATVRELIGQAADEIAKFVTSQEIRVRSLERRIMRDRTYNGFLNVNYPIDGKH